jgi:hypothetical protein
MNDPLTELIRSVTGNDGAPAGSSETAAASVPAGAVAESLAQNTAQLVQLQNLFRAQADATLDNTRAVSGNTIAHEQGAASAAAGVARTVAGATGAGLFFSPIISGLMKLFGGGRSEEPPAPLPKFDLPAPIRVQAANMPSGLIPLDYNQSGQPRPVASQPANVTVQVQAMDSRSFLDHSEDIANAVRRAMLESSALNDVVSEL